MILAKPWLRNPVFVKNQVSDSTAPYGMVTAKRPIWIARNNSVAIAQTL